MNFIPPVPQFQQQTYGMGYGDWHQYAGFGKANPFGGAAQPFDKSADKGASAPAGAAVPNPIDTNPAMPPVDYSFKPAVSYGAKPQDGLGMTSPNQFGMTSEQLINQHYGE